MRRTGLAKVAVHSDKICCHHGNEIDHFLCPETPLDQLRELSPEVVFKFVKSIKTGSIRSLRARVLLRARWDPREPGPSASLLRAAADRAAASLGRRASRQGP